MKESASQALLKAEQETVSAIRSTHPERLDRPAPTDPEKILGEIGVTFLSPRRPSGYIRLFPQDFIVEEVLLDGTVVPIVSSEKFKDSEDCRTLWADLIKVALPWPHAQADLLESLDVEGGKIGHAGIKDAFAVTSQRLSLRGVKKEHAEALSHPHLMLRPVKHGSGALQPGDLAGNRFTIFVRGDANANIEPFMKNIASRGFVNYYGPQRFGTRIISHRLGQKILQNDIGGALRVYFGEPGPFDVPLYRDLRLSLGEAYGDWETMLRLARHFPFTLRDEITVLEALERDPLKTRAAISLIKDQVKMWVYAYASWLVNRHFSRIAEVGGEMPETLPLPFSPRGPLPEYRELMAYDRTDNYLETMKLYPYLQAADRSIQSLIVPEAFQWRAVPEGWVVRFVLPKGAYATSYLSHIFQVHEGMPIPEWVKLEEVDSFNALGEGSMEEIKNRFAKVMVRRDLRNEENKGEDE